MGKCKRCGRDTLFSQCFATTDVHGKKIKDSAGMKFKEVKTFRKALKKGKW